MGWRRALLLLALAAALSGCQTIGGWFSSDKTEEPPAELPEFTSSLRVDSLWSVSTGAGINRSRPNLRPYFDDDELWVADHRGRISVVDAESGRVLRRIDTDFEVSSGPAVSGSMVLFGTFDGQLVVLDRASGNVRWRAQLSSEMLARPVVHDGVVIARCIDGRTFGFDAGSGQRRWIHDRSVPLLTLRGTSDPLVRAGQVFIGYDDGVVVALRVNDGGLIWEQRVSIPEGRTELDRLADIDGPMAIVGTDLYVVTYRGRLASLALESGRVLWIREVPSYTGVSVQRTQLAVSDRDSSVWLVDRRNGSTLWRDENLARRRLTRPVFVGDHLVSVDFQGYMHWQELERGDFVARVRPTRSAAASAPLVVGETLYLLDEDGTLSAWRARN